MKLKNILTVVMYFALGVLLAVPALVALFGGIEALGVAFNAFLGVCEYTPSFDRAGVVSTATEACEVFGNRDRRDLAAGVAKLLFGTPLAIFSFRALRKAAK